MYKWSIATFWR